MRVILPPECDSAWFRSLSQWQREELVALFRQGKHLPDRTDHGGDMRWRQAGCKTRVRMYKNWWQRTSPTDTYAHERVIIRPRAYGYDAIGIRRNAAYVVDAETGEMSQAPEAWVPVWVWHIQPGSSTSFDPEVVNNAS